MTKVFAHRGFSGCYPENTMLAFEKAIELGADGLETDVHLTKDGQVVMIHDESPYRTTGDKGLVMDYTLEELRKFDASYKDRFGDKFSNNPIPTLKEYFELVSRHDGFMTNIEVKTDRILYKGIEEAVLELIDEFSLRDRIIISSFNHHTVKRFKELAPDMKCGFLVADWIINVGGYTKAQGVECIHPPFFQLTDELHPEMKNAGCEINTWTVNEEADIKRMIDLGVDCIIGDYPDRALRALGRTK